MERQRTGTPDRRARRRMLGRHVHPRTGAGPRGTAGKRRVPGRPATHGSGSVHGTRRDRARHGACGRRRPSGRDRPPAAAHRHGAGALPGGDAHTAGARGGRSRQVHPAGGGLRDRRGALSTARARRPAGRGGDRGSPRSPRARQGPRDPGRISPTRLMDVVTGVAELRAEHGPIFTVVGVFDGLHRGHAYLLEHLVAESERRAAHPAVITFDAHPDEVLTGSAPPLLIHPEERLERLAAAGVEVTVVQHFDDDVRRTPYDAFVATIQSGTSLAGLLMTPDAAFGFERRGTPDALAALGRERGFDVVVVPPFTIDGRAVRSSDIRAAITAGGLTGAGGMRRRGRGPPARLEAGPPERLVDAALVVLEPGHDEQRVGQPIEVGDDVFADR